MNFLLFSFRKIPKTINCVHVVLCVVCLSGVVIPVPHASPWLNLEQKTHTHLRQLILMVIMVTADNNDSPPGHLQPYLNGIGLEWLIEKNEET